MLSILSNVMASMSSLAASTPFGVKTNDEEKTVPNTPEDTSSSQSNGDFARLIPANRSSRIAFDEVVDMLRTPSSGWSDTNLEKFLHVEKGKARLDEIIDTDSESQISSIPIMLWTGYYRLNMDIPPSNIKLGWVVGRGRGDLGNRGIDFLLTSRSLYDVAGRHARFYHNSSSGALMVFANRRPAVLNGTFELSNDECAITAPITGISFGDLSYRLTFTSLNPQIYTRQLKNLDNSSEALPAFMSPTPASTDYPLRDYTVKTVFSEGSTCVMSSGIVNRTGAWVAIKEMKRNTRNSSALAHEIEINKAISPHVRLNVSSDQ